MKTSKEKSEIHYYTDDIDCVFADIDGKIHIYNIVKKDFVPCNIGLDVMKWHEFPANRLQEMIRITENNFK